MQAKTLNYHMGHLSAYNNNMINTYKKAIFIILTRILIIHTIYSVFIGTHIALK